MSLWVRRVVFDAVGDVGSYPDSDRKSRHGRAWRAEQSRRPLGRCAQISTCSDMARASSISMPRYRTVLSIFVCPSRS